MATKRKKKKMKKNQVRVPFPVLLANVLVLVAVPLGAEVPDVNPALLKSRFAFVKLVIGIIKTDYINRRIAGLEPDIKTGVIGLARRTLPRRLYFQLFFQEHPEGINYVTSVIEPTAVVFKTALQQVAQFAALNVLHQADVARVKATRVVDQHQAVMVGNQCFQLVKFSPTPAGGFFQEDCPGAAG